jgi:hypothetical protein
LLQTIEVFHWEDEIDSSDVQLRISPPNIFISSTNEIKTFNMKTGKVQSFCKCNDLMRFYISDNILVYADLDEGAFAKDLVRIDFAASSSSSLFSFFFFLLLAERERSVENQENLFR